MARIPIMTPEIAADMPHPERAWALRPTIETEPMFEIKKRTGFVINLNNFVMRMEYEKLHSDYGLGLGEPVTRAMRLQWEQEMIEKYSPETAAIIDMFQQIGAQA